MERAQLVSPPLPSGQSWLVNALLALDVRLTGHGGLWRAEPAGETLVPRDFREMLKWFLPVLHARARFGFREPLEVFWDHQLAYAQYPARKTILMVRDPRDAFFSYFRRQLYEHPDDSDYQDSEACLLRLLTTPQLWVSPVTLPMMLPAADIFAYFCLVWLHQLPPAQRLVVRFEDTRSDPAGQLRRVLDFLALERTEVEIAQAVAASTTAKAAAVNQTMQARTGVRRMISRAGSSGEGLAALSPKALSHFAGPAQKLIELLGYAPLKGVTRWAPPDSGLLARAAPALEAFDARLSELNLGAAEAGLRTALNAAQIAGDEELSLLLAGQLLALLWTRAILRPALMELPLAVRMIRCLAVLNAEFSQHPPIRRAAAEILDPLYPLHHLGAHEKVFLSEDPDFRAALLACRASGQPLLWWNPVQARLTRAGFGQLCDLLDGRNPAMLIVSPVLTPAGEADFGRRAWERHATWGGEYRLSPEPAAAPLMLRVALMAPGADLVSCTAFWPVYQACGVLAES